MVTSESGQMLDLFSHYQKGVLARSGGVLEQPAKYLQAMKIIENQLRD